MKVVTVLEERGGTVEYDIRRRLAQWPDICRNISTRRSCVSPDVLVISGKTADCAVESCSILLMPGHCALLPSNAGCVVSYGMSAKDTITLSSVGEDECVIAVQRGFATVWGKTVDRQELVVKRLYRSPEHLLAVEGTLLLLGAYEL